MARRRHIACVNGQANGLSIGRSPPKPWRNMNIDRLADTIFDLLEKTVSPRPRLRTGNLGAASVCALPSVRFTWVRHRGSERPHAAPLADIRRRTANGIARLEDLLIAAARMTGAVAAAAAILLSASAAAAQRRANFMVDSKAACRRSACTCRHGPGVTVFRV